MGLFPFHQNSLFTEAGLLTLSLPHLNVPLTCHPSCPISLQSHLLLFGVSRTCPFLPSTCPSGILLSALRACLFRCMTFCYFIDAWIGAQALLGTSQVTSCKSMFIITIDLFSHLGNDLQDTSHFGLCISESRGSDKAWWGQGRCVFPTRIDFPATEVGLQPDACLLLPTFPLTPTILFQGWERVLPSFIQIADHILDP